MSFVRRLYLLLVALALLLLVGCTVYYVRMPTALVLLTGNWPSMDRCTGVLVAPRQVLTAAHCVEAIGRVVTPLGQEGRIVGFTLLPGHDIAILHTDRIMWVAWGDNYATMSKAQYNVVGVVWASCPWYQEHIYRYVYYVGPVDVETAPGVIVHGDHWRTLPSTDGQNRACGGDSGGAIYQNGKFVGTLSRVASDNPFMALGVDVLTVPGEVGAQLVEATEVVNAP